MLLKKEYLGKLKNNREKFSLTPTATVNTKHSRTPSQDNKKTSYYLTQFLLSNISCQTSKKKKKLKDILKCKNSLMRQSSHQNQAHI